MLKLILLVTCLLVALSSIQTASVDSTSLRVIEKQILDTLLNGYDPRIRPNGSTSPDGPTNVKVNAYIRQLTGFDFKNGRMQIQITFRQEWTDPRLAFASISTKLPFINMKENSIWLPDTFFSNAVDGRLLDILSKNSLLRVKPDGHVLYSTRVQLDAMCPTIESKYPFDYQECDIKFASYAYTTDDVVYQWKENAPLQFSKSIGSLTDYHVAKYAAEGCSSKTNTGEYSCLKASLLMKSQHSGRVGVLLYIPCVMYVIAAYWSFFIDVQKQFTARLLYITLVLFSGSINIGLFNINDGPRNKTRACDVWSGVCLTFVSGAMWQFFLINWLVSSNEKAKKEQNIKVDVENQLSTMEPLVVDEKPNNVNERQQMIMDRFKHLRSTPEKIDHLARFLYPLLFVAFNLVYWVTYCPSEPGFASNWELVR